MSRAVEWKNYEVLLLAEDAVRVRDIVSNVKEQLGIDNLGSKGGGVGWGWGWRRVCV